MSNTPTSGAPGSEDVVDYAIVGGGVSGLYAAWRLLVDDDADPAPTVKLFESGSRLGGRLLSVVPPQIPSARVELGGMRYIKETQPWVSDLIEHLGLATEPLPADEGQNIFYARQHLLRHSDLVDAGRLPYHLDDDNKSKEVLGALVAEAAVRTLAPTIEKITGKSVTSPVDLGQLTDADRLAISTLGTYEGTPLYQIPLRYLLLRALGMEGLALAQDSGGYDSVLHTWNAADGFWWNVGDYSATTTYLHVKEGYERLPLELAEKISTRCEIRLETRAVRFDSTGPDDVIELVVESNGRSEVIKARKLLLALPRRSLELLEQSGPILDPANTAVQRLIKSVTPIPLFKLAICYENAWWEQIPGPTITSGRSTTDLPIRQCYYWKVDPVTKRAVILIYDDGVDLDYWSDLRDGSAPKFENLESEVELPGWNDYPAPKRMVDEVHRQLLELHGVTAVDAPAPYAAAYRDWGEDPFGGGANFWPVGVKSYEVGRAILQPDPDYPVYICGEAYSHAQGWVEGSLATTEAVLEKIGLAPPAWATGQVVPTHLPS